MPDGLLTLMRDRYPDIKWERPIEIEVFGTNVVRMCCRVCIANEGLKGHEVAERGFDTIEDFERHMEGEHG